MTTLQLLVLITLAALIFIGIPIAMWLMADPEDPYDLYGRHWEDR